MKPFYLLASVLAAIGSGAAFAQMQSRADPATVDAALKAAFATAPAEWQPRLTGDATMQACSAANNAPSAADAKAISAREVAAVEYPADGRLLGDWTKGEAIAQSGYGLRFTDYPARNPNGGNCYACHQMTKVEVSYGTIGPSLLEYGKIRKFADADTRAAYAKIYNSHAAFPPVHMGSRAAGAYKRE